MQMLFAKKKKIFLQHFIPIDTFYLFIYITPIKQIN